MAEKYLKREPHNISKDVWWYESNAGIEIIIYFGVNKIKSHIISWRTIYAALARKNKKGKTLKQLEEKWNRASSGMRRTTEAE